jgi:hypothetical protein
MARSTLSAELEDGTVLQVVADGRDIRAWEGLHAESFMGVDTTYTIVSELAGLAAIRSGQFDGDLPAWLAVLVDVREVASAGGVPTRPNRHRRRPVGRSR